MATPPGMHKGNELAGKVALVTGAARNIGRAIALALASGGASVAVSTRSALGQAQTVAAEVRALGVESEAYCADLAERAQIEAMAQAVLERFGRVDLLILNAAVREHGPFTDITYEDWRRILGIGLDSAFLLTKACLPSMIESGAGCIVTLGGVTALLGAKGRAHVAAAKHGLIGFTKALANDLAEHNIRVNCVSPGQIDTTRAPGTDRPSRITQIPLGRKGESEEIAAMVRFLCSPDAGYITGQTIHINGGLVMP